MTKTALIAVMTLALFGAPVMAQETAQSLFESGCGGCHQASGQGSSGLAPAVANPELFTALGDKAAPYLAGVIMGGLSGKITSKGEEFIALAMPTQTWLSDDEALAIANYVLADLNGLTIEATLGDITEARATPPKHSALRAMRNEVYP